jgi:hypothetical protein
MRKRKKREREKVYLCSPVAWRPASHRPALLSLFLFGPSRTEPACFLYTQRGPAQSAAVAVRFLPSLFH